MPKPHARATRAISPGHLPMMVRLLARPGQNDLYPHCPNERGCPRPLPA